MAKAQISIEFFFATVLSFLAIFWLLNYLNTVRASEIDVAVQQEQLAAKEMGELVNIVCLTSSSITLRLPCIVSVNQSLYYTFNSSGNNITISSPDVPGAWNVTTLCPVFANFTAPDGSWTYVACNIQERSFSQRACISRNATGVKIVYGICNQ